MLLEQQELLETAPPRALEPVEFTVLRECHFKKKDGRRLGCARCERAKKHPAHFGAPPSVNSILSGQGSGNAMVYANLKKLWGDLLTARLLETGLPRGLARVVVEGEATFPDRGRRDQGNFRFIVEKALGDALKRGGWLADDDWSSYEFGGFAYRHVPGVSRTRLTLFPYVGPDAPSGW